MRNPIALPYSSVKTEEVSVLSAKNHWFGSLDLVGAAASELQASVFSSLVTSLTDSDTLLTKNKK